MRYQIASVAVGWRGRAASVTATVGVVRAGLVDGEDKRLGDVDVRGAVGGPDDLLCDVFGAERLETLVDLVGSALIAAEAGDGEAGLDHARLDLRNADGRVDKLLEQRRRERVDRKLGGAVDGAARVAFAAGDGAEVDDVARVALLELAHKDLGEVDEALDIGVDHDVDLVGRDVAYLVGAEHEAGVVDEDVDVLGPVRQAVDQAVELLAVAHVERERGKVAAGARLTLLVGERALGRRLRQLVSSARGEYHIAAGTREQDRRRLANAARGTRDEHSLIVQALCGENGRHAGKDTVRSTG